MQQNQNQLFDRSLIKTRLQKKHNQPIDFISTLLVEDLHIRLASISRDFKKAVIIGSEIKSFPRKSTSATSPINFTHFSTLAKTTKAPLLNINNFNLPKKNYDLIVSLLDLQVINNVPKFLNQIHAHLKPDGLMMMAFIGNETLTELRQAWLKADEEILGGANARVAPFIDVKSAGNLLQNSGFALPVADIDHHIVRYADAISLMKELKFLGANNPLFNKPDRLVTKNHLALACKYYEESFSDKDSRVRATLDIIWMSGWKPDASQQKPLKPGSAKTSLAKALSSKI